MERTSDLVQVQDVELDRAAHRVRVRGTLMTLPHKEYQLLERNATAVDRAERDPPAITPGQSPWPSIGHPQVYHATGYAGFPAAAEAGRIAAELFDQVGQD